MVQAWLLGTDSKVSVRLAGGSEDEAGPPKLLSLREETPELALPDSVELLPSRMDCGLVGEAGIGCRGDWREEGWGVEGGTVSRDRHVGQRLGFYQQFVRR